MASSAKWVVAGILGLVALVLVAALMAPLLVDREGWRADLEADLSASLGRATTIERIAGARLLPMPRLRLEGIRIARTADPDGAALVTIDALRVDVALWPLVSGRFHLSEVVAEHPVVVLPPSSAPGQAPGGAFQAAHQRLPPTRPSPSGHRIAAAAGAVAAGHMGVVLVSERPARTGAASLEPAAATAENATAVAPDPGSAAPGSGAGAAASVSSESDAAGDDGATSAGPAPDAAPGAAGAGRVGTLPPPSLPPIDRLLIRDGEITLETRAEHGGPPIHGLKLVAGPIRAGGQGRLDGTFRLDAALVPATVPGSISAEFVVADPPTRLALIPLRLRLGEPRADRNAAPLELEGDLRLATSGGPVRLEALELRAGALQACGQAVLAPTPTGSRIDASARVSPFDLRAWLLEHFGVQVPGRASSLREVAADFDVQLEPSPDGWTMAVDDLELRVDATRAAGWARLRMPSSPPQWLPAGRAALALDRLDLDHYLPGTGAATDSLRQPAPRPPARERPPLPAVDALPEGSGQLALHLGAGSVELGGLRYETLALDGVVDPGLVALDAVAGLYGGTLDARLDAAAQPRANAAAGVRTAQTPEPAAGATAPELSLQATARGVSLGGLLTDLQQDTRAPAPVTGIADVDLDLSARGSRMPAIAATLGGEARLALRDGAVTVVDLGQLIIGTVGAAGVSADEVADLTRFNALTLSARGETGTFRSDDIRLRSDLLQVDGAGRLDLPQQQLALDLEAVLVEAPDGRGIRELEGIPIPISASGHWADPRWSVDARAVLDRAARRALQEDDGLLDELEERTGIKGLGDGLRQLLPGLMGN